MIEMGKESEPEQMGHHDPPNNDNPFHLTNKTYKKLGPILGAVLCYNLGSIYFGYSLVYFNAIKYQKLHKIFSIDMDPGVGEGFFSGMIEFGAIFGAIASRFILKFLSRKQSYFVANLVAFVAGLLVLVESMKTLLVGRVLQGAAVGIYSTIIPLTVKEYVPVQIAGFMGSIFAPAVVLGTLLGYLIPYILSTSREPQDYWSYSFGFTLITVTLQQILLLAVFTSQTPKYLIRKGRVDEARQFIAQMYKEEYCEEVLTEKIGELNIIQSKSHGKKEAAKRPPVEVQLQDDKKYQEEPIEDDKGSDAKTEQALEESRQAGYFWDEDTVVKYPKDVPKAKFLAFWMQLFQNLTGIYVITLYGRELAAIALPDFEQSLPILLNVLRLIMSFVAIILLKKYGRRQIMLPGVIVLAFGLLGLVIGVARHNKQNQPLELFILFCLLLIISTFAISIYPITWLYIPEIVQPPLIPFTTIMNWVSAYLVVFLFPIINKSHEIKYAKGAMGMFLFFTFCMIAHAGMLWVAMRETRLKKESEIRRIFKQPIQNPCKRNWLQ